MTLKKILIIGNVSDTQHLGYMFVNASKDLGLIPVTCDLKKYYRSLDHLIGRIFFKITQRRTIDWWSFNQEIYAKINNENPNIVMITGLFPMQNYIFKLCNKKGIKVINFMTDSPFIYKCPIYLRQLPSYDLISTTKSDKLDLFRQEKVKNIIFQPFAFDPHWHQLPENISAGEYEEYTSDISFIGYGLNERVPYMNAIAKSNKSKDYSLKIYGFNWKNIQLEQWKKCPPVVDRSFTLAMNLSKLSICLLRKTSQDLSTQRTFEIASCGGCGIYEDTPDHRSILAGYPDYGFFSSPQDLAEKCEWLLGHSVEREEMRQLGINIIVKQENTYSARLKTIIDFLDSH